MMMMMMITPCDTFLLKVLNYQCIWVYVPGHGGENRYMIVLMFCTFVIVHRIHVIPTVLLYYLNMCF